MIDLCNDYIDENNTYDISTSNDFLDKYRIDYFDDKQVVYVLNLIEERLDVSDDFT